MPVFQLRHYFRRVTARLYGYAAKLYATTARGVVIDVSRYFSDNTFFQPCKLFYRESRRYLSASDAIAARVGRGAAEY